MPIDRNMLWKNKFKAMQFLQSTAGVILHELGHYIVANENDHVAGPELEREFEETSPLPERQKARDNFMIVPSPS